MDISRSSTVSKKIPEINSLYVYATRHRNAFHQRKQPGEGYRYSNHKAIEKAGEGEMYIYHQTFDIDGVMKGLTLITKDKRKTYVQKFFKEAVETIESDRGMLAAFKQAGATPKQLGIYYTY